MAEKLKKEGQCPKSEMKRKVRKTTRNVIRMKGTRKLHSVAQFSLRAPGRSIEWGKYAE